MIKSYTYPVPDELHVNSFTSNAVYSGTYEGPETLYLSVQHGEPIQIWSETVLESKDPNIEIVTLDANTYPEVADYLMNQRNEEYTFTFEAITNPDGTIHNEISNPRLNEYYKVFYVGGSKPWDFRVIERDKKFVDEERVEKDLLLVKRIRSNYDLGAENDVADNFISAAENYLDLVRPLYSWRFEKPPANTVAPKLPLSIVKLAKELEI